MTVALGASAYSVAVFHLMTHAFFKALLFLGAGSVIIGMHHNQDIRYMGGIRKYMPITWITFLLATLSLIGTPFFSGYYSKEHVIEAAHAANVWGASFAYYCVLIGVFVTSLYSFRLYFLVFHGKERYDQVPADDEHRLADGEKPKESSWVVTLPLILLAIPSVIIGAWAVEPMLFGDFFDGVIYVDGDLHPAMATIASTFHGWVAYATHAVQTVPFWLVVAGFVVALYLYVISPGTSTKIYNAFSGVNRVLENKYYVDWIYENVFAAGARVIGKGFWKGGDKGVIDGFIIGGSTKLVAFCAVIARKLQTGYVYHYAASMLVGVIVLISFFVLVR